MQILPLQLRRIISGLLISAALGPWVGFCPLASAQTLFSGITSVEARSGADRSVQVLNFQADLPFQYQIQVLDKDTILLRLYNARLAQNLITPEGGVNLLAGGLVQSAKLKASTDNASGEGVQEIVLSGPGLGRQTIQVLGAQKRTAQYTAPSAPGVMMARVGEQATKKANSSHKSKLGFDFSNLHVLAAAGGLIHDDNHPARRAASVQDRPSVTPIPTRIEMETPASRPLVQIAQAPQITEMGSSTEVPNTKASTSTGESENDSFQSADGKLSNETDVEAQAQVMVMMPRYTGGAKPIQAMTTDNQGHPVLIQPKNQPIPEFSVGNANGGYNTLFQAEPEGRQRVSQFMNDALIAYRANRFDVALREVQQALMLDTHNADLLAALAEIQLKLGQSSLAQQNYMQAQTISQEKYGPRYAQVLTLNGNRPEAIRVLEALYKQNPKQVQVAYMLGTLNEELGQTDRALTYLQQAAQLHPASADIQYNLGLAYELSGDRQQAEKHYRQALGLNPTAPDVTKALARVRQGGV